MICFLCLYFQIPPKAKLFTDFALIKEKTIMSGVFYQINDLLQDSCIDDNVNISLFKETSGV